MLDAKMLHAIAMGYPNRHYLPGSEGVHPLKWLRDRGWHKGDFVNQDNKVCIMGAMSNCTFASGKYRRSRPEEFLEAKRVVQEQFPDRAIVEGKDGFNQLAYFNDHEDTTLEEVEMVLEKVYGPVV